MNGVIDKFWQTLRPLRKVGKLRGVIDVPVFSESAGPAQGGLRVGLKNSSVLIRTAIGTQLQFDEETTIEGWFRTRSQSLCNFYHFIASGAVVNPIHIYVEAGTIYAKINVAGAETVLSGDYPYNEWAHIALVYSVANSSVTLYVNGVVVDSASIADPIGGWNANERVYVGTTSSSYTASSTCDISHVRVWSVARSVDEINTYMSLRVGDAQPGLEADWYFNEGTGTSVEDYSANTNTLTISGVYYEWLTSDVPTIKLGVSYVVGQFVVSTTNSYFSFKFPVAAPTDADFLLVIRWEDSAGDIQRRRFWDMDGVDITPLPAKYAGEKLPSGCYLEVWNIDGNDTVNLTSTLSLDTSILNVVTDATTTTQESAATITLSTALYATLPATFPISFTEEPV